MSRSTNYCTCHFKIHTKSIAPAAKSAPLPRNPHFSVIKIHIAPTRSKSTSKNNIKMPKRSFCSKLPPISEKRATCPKVTVHCTGHEIRARRRPPPCPKYRACHEIIDNAPRSPAPITKSRLKTTNLAPASRSDRQILRACAVKMHFEDLEVKECTVNSSEIAVRPDEHLRSDTRPQPRP